MEVEVEVQVGLLASTIGEWKLIAWIAILLPPEIYFLNGKQSTASTCQKETFPSRWEDTAVDLPRCGVNTSQRQIGVCRTAYP